MTGFSGTKTMMKPLVVAASIFMLAACGNSSAPNADTSASSGASAGAEPAAAPPAASAETGNWKIIPELSRLTFSATQTGDAFTGEFKRFTTSIQLDPSDVSTAHIEVVVDMASADAKDEQRNQALPNNEWFGTSQFATAVFRSDSVKKLEDGSYEAAGTLTIRDVSRPVTLPFTLDIDGDTGRAFGEIKLMRTDFNVGTGEEWGNGKWVGLDVTVTFDVTATRIGT
jgi:polyisoprenoid-binding protein YceI